MNQNSIKAWTPTTIAFLAGAIATALVPLTVPILGAIGAEFGVDRHDLGWVVSVPTLVCALGALIMGVIVDRWGDVRVLLSGMVLVILGNIGVSLAPSLEWLYAARLFQGFGYVRLSVAGAAFIQRTTSGEMRKAAMAFWAAHTPVGFAAAVYLGSQLLAAGMSWRYSFMSHAVAAVLIGLLVLFLRKVPSAATISRSAGTTKVLTTLRVYAVALGAGATAMLQVSVMVMLPGMLQNDYGLSGPQAALTTVFVMLMNLAGAMAIVTTRLRNMPRIALPVSMIVAAALGCAIVSRFTVTAETTIACAAVFSVAVGIGNALVWSFIPAAMPSPDASGATAGLITQGSFLGVLIGPPTFFWIQQNNPTLFVGVTALLALAAVISLVVLRQGDRVAMAH